MKTCYSIKVKAKKEILQMVHPGEKVVLGIKKEVYLKWGLEIVIFKGRRKDEFD